MRRCVWLCVCEDVGEGVCERARERIRAKSAVTLSTNNMNQGLAHAMRGYSKVGHIIEGVFIGGAYYRGDIL